jgi:hypothetical protein
LHGYIIDYCEVKLIGWIKTSHRLFLWRNPHLDVNYIGNKICNEQFTLKDVDNLFDVECFAHDFYDSMQDKNLTYHQQQIFQHLISSMSCIYFLKWTPQSKKNVLTKCLTNHL